MTKSTKRIVFIVPYYGQWPPYFSIWLKTVSKNPTVDFLIITDLEIYDYLSDNIKILSWPLGQLREYIQSKFDFKINLEKPYKLCDFRPAFGYIFQEYIEEYDFWGNCDIDCVFGNIRKFLDPLLEEYDAIGTYGHMSLYRNKEWLNILFKKDGALYNYKEVFSNSENYAFDENSGIKNIFRMYGVNCLYHLECMGDVCTTYKSFQLLHGLKNYKKQFFIWEDGRAFQCYMSGQKLKYREFMYIHFQKKTPVPIGNIKIGCYMFYNQMIPRENSDKDWDMLNYQKFYNLRLIMKIQKIKWYIKKMLFYVMAGKKQRGIYCKKRKYNLK